MSGGKANQLRKATKKESHATAEEIVSPTRENGFGEGGRERTVKIDGVLVGQSEHGQGVALAVEGVDLGRFPQRRPSERRRAFHQGSGGGDGFFERGLLNEIGHCGLGEVMRPSHGQRLPDSPQEACSDSDMLYDSLELGESAADL